MGTRDELPFVTTPGAHCGYRLEDIEPLLGTFVREGIDPAP